jgi:hypothetical protein
MGRYREIPRRVNSGHIVGAVNTSDRWPEAQGHDGTSLMVNGGAGMNVRPLATFEKMGFEEKELMRTNTSLSAFIGEVTNTKGVMSVELTVCSKTLTTTFFVVDVNGRYNLLLGCDWIHANGCVPSMLHQCVVQWVGDEAEIVHAEE